MPVGNEPNLSADDPSLSQRARELIRIGEVGIARENEAEMKKFFHPDFRFYGPDGGELTREGLWEFFAACRAAFDDFAVTRQQIFEGGQYVGARTTFSGIFRRPFTASPIGTIQPSGKPMFFNINNVFGYAPDGTLIREWAQYDSRLCWSGSAFDWFRPRPNSMRRPRRSCNGAAITSSWRAISRLEVMVAPRSDLRNAR
jgi:hypothetical protein